MAQVDRHRARIPHPLGLAGARARASKGVPSRCPLPAAPPRGPRARARRPAAAPSWRERLPGLPALDQRQLDVLGLGLVAARRVPRLPPLPGLGRRRGRRALVDGLRWAIGGCRLRRAARRRRRRRRAVLRPVLPALRPFRAGALCLLGAATLAYAAGTLGLGPDGTPADPWAAEAVQPRGGLLGEALHSAAATLFSEIGAHILASSCSPPVRSCLTGATVAGVLRSTSSGVADTTRALRRTPDRPAEHRRPASARTGPPTRSGPPVRTPRGPRRDALDGAVRFPDLFGAPLEAAFGAPQRARRAASRPGPGRGRAACGAARARASGGPAARPAGRPARPSRRPARADARTERRRVRPARRSHPQALDRRAGTPDTAGQEKTVKRLVEALGHLGVQAQVIGAVAGPHITRYELQLAPGGEDGQGREPQERPRLRAGRNRDPDPRPDPGQARRGGRGAQPQPAHRHARRRPRRPAQGVLAAHRVAGQGRQRQADRRRPRAHAAPARRRHDGRGQVGLRQRDALVDPAARHARRGAPRARRPQAGRAQPLRGDPAPADAGHHEPADGGQRAAEPRARDGVALRRSCP